MRFSVITINLNNCEGLEHTIKSVVLQDFHDFEFIVIDGGSNDGSVDVIQSFAGEISCWVSEKDNGIYQAMNKGIDKAHGDYCLFLNSGDTFFSNSVLSSLKNYDEDILVGKVSINRDNNIISPPPEGELTFYHLYSGAIPHQATFIKTELLKNNPYDESLRISSDWKFFVQTLIFGNCSIRYLDLFIAKYDTSGISSVNPELMRIEKEKILSQLLPSRILMDYKRMKDSECLVQTLTPQLKINYGVDKILFYLGKFLLGFRKGRNG